MHYHCISDCIPLSSLLGVINSVHAYKNIYGFHGWASPYNYHSSSRFLRVEFVLRVAGVYWSPFDLCGKLMNKDIAW
jgi:hypothetical protein